MKGPRILLVEDEPNIARGLIFNLAEEGFRVTHVETGEQALKQLGEGEFSLIVLDLMLPGLDGIQVCRRIRLVHPRLPILMLTARSMEKDRVGGLVAGADDYMTKPFSLEEFLLRVKGMLRRSGWYRQETAAVEEITFGANRINLAERRALTPRGEISLTELEVRMLKTFAQREGEVLSRKELLRAVWGLHPGTETRTLDNFIVRMRKYFEPDPVHPIHFLTVRGRGYRFVPKSASLE